MEDMWPEHSSRGKMWGSYFAEPQHDTSILQTDSQLSRQTPKDALTYTHNYTQLSRKTINHAQILGDAIRNRSIMHENLLLVHMRKPRDVSFTSAR